MAIAGIPTPKRFQRIERFLFPPEAMREAVTNAIVHKDYSSGIPIQISVYEDKIIIWNAGRLPDILPIERLLEKHPSIPYNPLIATAFFRAGYIEAWGRGIEKIRQECKKAKTLEPHIAYDFGGLMVTFRARVPDTNSGQTTQKTTQKILAILKDNPKISRVELTHLLGNITDKGVKYHLNKLKQENRIRRVGPDKGGYWEIVEQ
ncbi:winged helix-turn-helix transcriptional regulator [bacterium]|nr:winged helix-turn-helix transcriptional regulator [bacterium]